LFRETASVFADQLKTCFKSLRTVLLFIKNISNMELFNIFIMFVMPLMITKELAQQKIAALVERLREQYSSYKIPVTTKPYKRK